MGEHLVIARIWWKVGDWDESQQVIVSADAFKEIQQALANKELVTFKQAGGAGDQTDPSTPIYRIAIDSMLP
jgi:hypothetical protein